MEVTLRLPTKYIYCPFMSIREFIFMWVDYISDGFLGVKNEITMREFVGTLNHFYPPTCCSMIENWFTQKFTDSNQKCKTYQNKHESYGFPLWMHGATLQPSCLLTYNLIWPGLNHTNEWYILQRSLVSSSCCLDNSVLREDALLLHYK